MSMEYLNFQALLIIICINIQTILNNKIIFNQLIFPFMPDYRIKLKNVPRSTQYTRKIVDTNLKEK